MISLLASIILSVVPVVAKERIWTVAPAGTSENGLKWWQVAQNGRPFASYSNERFATEVARELNQRGVGPRWPRDLAKLFDEVGAVALAKTPAPTEEEQRKWWADYEKRNRDK